MTYQRFSDSIAVPGILIPFLLTQTYCKINWKSPAKILSITQIRIAERTTAINTTIVWAISSRLVGQVTFLVQILLPAESA